MKHLWDAPAPAATICLPVVDAEQLACDVERLRNDREFQAQLEERLAPYRTPVTWRTLMTRLD